LFLNWGSGLESHGMEAFHEGGFEAEFIKCQWW
jgi:hypothetical protein